MAEGGGSAEGAAGPPERGRTRARGLFEQFPHGLLLVGEERRVLSVNERARELLMLEGPLPEPGSVTCCELVCEAIERQVGVEGGSCVTERALRTGEPLPGVQIEVTAGTEPISVTAARVDAEDVRVLFQLHPGAVGEGGPAAVGGPTAGAEPPKLRIHMLGPTRIELSGDELDGDWVRQRPGLLLKYLVCKRHAVTPSDQIAEALWPTSSPSEALTSLRHYVHVLREKLEPGRPKRATSSFVETQRGGYRLDSEGVWIDAGELEQRAAQGMRLFVENELEPAGAVLESAVRLYGGQFLIDEPDAEWLLEERERLHHLVARACRALVDVKLMTGEEKAASEHLRRLADMEPLDTEVQRQFIESCLKQGRRSDAVRRYELLRKRTLRDLGHEPDFTISDLAS